MLKLIQLNSKCTIKNANLYHQSYYLFWYFAIRDYLSQQTGSISGKITDKSNNEELIGANVMVVGTTIGASSDLDGKFNIKGLQPVNILLRFHTFLINQ